MGMINYSAGPAAFPSLSLTSIGAVLQGIAWILDCHRGVVQLLQS